MDDSNEYSPFVEEDNVFGTVLPGLCNLIAEIPVGNSEYFFQLIVKPHFTQ